MRNTAILTLVVLTTACEFDNYSPPESTLEGRVVYQNQPVQVRENAITLELWQDGYALRRDIPVHVRQDGTFSATLFEGDYKLVRKQNNGPWANDLDTIRISLRNPMSVDVPVNPFFVIQNATIQRAGTTLNAAFAVQQATAGRNLERVALYVGTTQFVDNRFNATRVERNVTNAAIGANTVSLDVASIAAGRDYVFARIGVKATGVEEMIYTPVEKIQLR